MATKSGKPPYGEYDGGRQAKQPKGNSLHYGPPEDAHKPNQSYFAEQCEHWGKEAEGKTMQSHKEVGFTGPKDRGSELEGKGPAEGNHKQPHGTGIGAGTTDIAEHHKGNTFGGDAHSFRPPAANKADGYGHSITERKGPLRMSGNPHAHRLGSRKK